MEDSVSTELRRDPADRDRRHLDRRRAVSFMVRDPTQLDAAVERLRTLTQPVGLTGTRDWDVSRSTATGSS
jgi:preprotein translocase subunit SecD